MNLHAIVDDFYLALSDFQITHGTDWMAGVSFESEDHVKALMDWLARTEGPAYGDVVPPAPPAVYRPLSKPSISSYSSPSKKPKVKKSNVTTSTGDSAKPSKSMPLADIVEVSSREQSADPAQFVVHPLRRVVDHGIDTGDAMDVDTPPLPSHRQGSVAQQSEVPPPPAALVQPVVPPPRSPASLLPPIAILPSGPMTSASAVLLTAGGLPSGSILQAASSPTNPLPRSSSQRGIDSFFIKARVGAPRDPSAPPTPGPSKPRSTSM